MASVGDGSSTVHFKPELPEGAKSVEKAAALKVDDDFLLDGKLADIKLSFGWKAPGIDVDASLAMYDADYKCVDVVWWDKMTSRFCSLRHVFDDRTGEKEGDNETIEVDILQMPYVVHFMVPVVTVYSKGKYLKDVQNLKMTILDTVHDGGKVFDVEIASFTPPLNKALADASAVVMGIFTRRGAWWNFAAVGKSGRGRTVKEIVATTPLDTVVRPVSFHAEPKRVYLWATEAKEVAASDFPMFGPQTSDCFVEIIYKNRRSLSEVVEKDLSPKWDMAKVYLGESTDSDHSLVEINLWDHDTHSDDDFLGSVALTLGGLIQQGVGVHEIALPLGASMHNDIKPRAGVQIKGEIVLKCEIVEPDAKPEAQSQTGA